MVTIWTPEVCHDSLYAFDYFTIWAITRPYIAQQFGRYAITVKENKMGVVTQVGTCPDMATAHTQQQHSHLISRIRNKAVSGEGNDAQMPANGPINPWFAGCLMGQGD